MYECFHIFYHMKESRGKDEIRKIFIMMMQTFEKKKTTLLRQWAKFARKDELLVWFNLKID